HGLHPGVSAPTGLHRIQQCERTGQGGGSTSPDQVRSLADPVSYVESRRERDTVLVKLSDGEDLFPSLEAAAREHDVESGTGVRGLVFDCCRATRRRTGSLPGRPVQVPLFFRLLAELTVVVLA